MISLLIETFGFDYDTVMEMPMSYIMSLHGQLAGSKKRKTITQPADVWTEIMRKEKYGK